MCETCDKLMELPEVKERMDARSDAARAKYDEGARAAQAAYDAATADARAALKAAEEAYDAATKPAKDAAIRQRDEADRAFDAERIEAANEANASFIARGLVPPFDAEWLKPQPTQTEREAQEAEQERAFLKMLDGELGGVIVVGE